MTLLALILFPALLWLTNDPTIALLLLIFHTLALGTLISLSINSTLPVLLLMLGVMGGIVVFTAFVMAILPVDCDSKPRANVPTYQMSALLGLNSSHIWAFHLDLKVVDWVELDVLYSHRTLHLQAYLFCLVILLVMLVVVDTIVSKGTFQLAFSNLRR